MGHNTAATEWPSIAISESTKTMIDRFFSLLDNKDEAAGSLLADEIFTPDGRACFGHQVFEGTDRMVAILAFVVVLLTIC